MTRARMIGVLGAATVGTLLATAVVAVHGSRAARHAEEATAAATPSTPTAVVSSEQISAAREYARSRGPSVAFAVIDSPGGRPRGLRTRAGYASASVTKAMLLLAVLRRASNRPLSPHERALLRPMITESDNDAATIVFHSVGEPGLAAVARAARMLRFDARGFWASAHITPGDQARLFYRIDRLVPSRHRDYALGLLSSIVPSQRWGIAKVARQRGYTVYFKGGWRDGINHQVALLEKDGRRFSLAVMTRQSDARGRRTEEGIARKLL